MANAPSRIVELIETFDRNIEAYKNQQYKETQLRREFINPFFEELGWDITNKAGYARAYKDVIQEDAIKIGGDTKAHDYCFRIDGVRKFFLEAKKPSVDIKADVHPAYQLRRYAWSAKLPTKKTKIHRKIKTKDNNIDSLVYELYELTKEEIKIIEQSSK